MIDEVNEHTLKQKQHSKRRFGRIGQILWALGLSLWVGVVIIGMQLLLGLVIAFLNLKGYLEKAGVMAFVQALVYVLSFLVLTTSIKKIEKRRGGLRAKQSRTAKPAVVSKKADGWSLLGLEGLPTWSDLLLAPIGLVVTMIVSGVVMAVAMKLMPNLSWDQQQQLGFGDLYDPVSRTMAFLALVIIAPLAEEIIFRGWLYGKLRTRVGAALSIILVSLVFAALHMQINVALVVGVMSVTMCLLREMTGTIWAGILVHMLKNGIAFYVLFVNPVLAPMAALSTLVL